MQHISALINQPDLLDEKRFELKETHISRVLVGRRRVFKFKKPVKLDFVDQSDLSKRTALCLWEFALNRRLSPEVYLDVELVIPPENSRSGNWAFFSVQKSALKIPSSPNQSDVEQIVASAISMCEDDVGSPVDVCVVMAHLPDENRLEECLESLDHKDMQRLASRLAEFHRSLSPRPPSGGFRNRLGNVISTLAGLQNLDFKELLEQSLKSQSNLLKKRSTREVDGHGDLRPDHIYITEDRVSIIDCVEFSPEIRQVDPFEDLAFTTMGLRLDGKAQLSRQLAIEYLHLNPDVRGYLLLDVYEVYRACVRLMVDQLQLQERPTESSQNPEDDGQSAMDAKRKHLEERSRQYQSLIHNLLSEKESNFDTSLWPGPMIIVLTGLPATGKSLIGRLIRLDGVPVLSSDILRKSGQKDINVRRPTDYGTGSYTEHKKLRNYQRLIQSVGLLLEKEKVICMDASFSRREYRKELFRYLEARDYRGRVLFLETRCSENVVQARLEKRRARGGVSDLTDFDTWKRIRDHFDPIAPWITGREFVVSPRYHPSPSRESGRRDQPAARMGSPDYGDNASSYPISVHHAVLDTSGEKRTGSILTEIIEQVPELQNR